MTDKVIIKDTQAYKQGFEDGTHWAIDENAKDHQGYYNKGYNKGIEDVENLFIYLEKDFLAEVFSEEYENACRFYDLVAKYGFKHILEKHNEWEKYQKEKIQFGDVVEDKKSHIKGVVLSGVGNSHIRGYTLGKPVVMFEWHIDDVVKTGRNVSGVLETLFEDSNEKN